LSCTGEPLQWGATAAWVMGLSLYKITEKTAELESCDAVAEEDWPEIENMFPFDPRGKNYWCNY